MGEPTTTLNQETAHRTAAGAAAQTAAPAKPALNPTAKGSAEGRKLIRNLVALLVVFSAVFLTLYVWSVLERHPRTDDAAARANVVGIAPRVAGQILKLNVQDNQAVKEGDVLFTLDSRAVEAQIRQVEAVLNGAKAQLEQAERDLQRYTDLFAKNATTQVTVSNASTQVNILRAAVTSNTACGRRLFTSSSNTYANTRKRAPCGKILPSATLNLLSNAPLVSKIL